MTDVNIDKFCGHHNGHAGTDKEVDEHIFNAKGNQKVMLDSTIKSISAVMGKMNNYSASVKCRMRPERIFSYNNGFKVKPMEGRYLSIPLTVLQDEFSDQTKSAIAPLVIVIAKYC